MSKLARSSSPQKPSEPQVFIKFCHFGTVCSLYAAAERLLRDHIQNQKVRVIHEPSFLDRSHQAHSQSHFRNATRAKTPMNVIDEQCEGRRETFRQRLFPQHHWKVGCLLQIHGFHKFHGFDQFVQSG